MPMTLKLKPEIKEEWVAALRSGQYYQGQGQLHSSRFGTHCCLGVLCDIAAKKENSTIEHYRWAHTEMPNPALKELVSATPLTDEEKAHSSSGWEITGELMPLNSTLADLNDEGVSFANIASLIEKQF